VKDERTFVAVGLLTQNDLDLLGSGFRTAFPVEQCAVFDELLRRIDDAEAEAEASAKMNASRQAD